MLITAIRNISLSTKLLCVFVLTIALVILLFRALFEQSVFDTVRDSMKLHVQRYLVLLSQKIGNPPDLALAQELSESLNLQIRILTPTFAWRSENFIAHHHHARDYQEPSHYQSRGHDGRWHTRFVIQDAPYSYIYNFTVQPKIIWFLHGLIAIVVIFSLLYLVIKYLIRPIGTIKHGIKRITAGDLQYKIPINSNDELGLLAQEFNNMADYVCALLESKRQLLLAISHELRSPLARSKVALSLLPDGSQKASLAEDIQEMESLISEILDAESLNQKQQALQLEMLDINQCIRQIADKYTDPIALYLTEDIPLCWLDKKRIKFVVSNLIQNALQHRKQATDAISIDTSLFDGQLKIRFVDAGIGITAEHLSRVTEQLYRVDASRQRTTGGFGLGLYITQMIIAAHGGTMDISSEPQVGTTVELLLPIVDQR